MKLLHTPAPWNIRFFRNESPELGFFIEAKNNNKPELGYGIEILMDDFGEHNGYPIHQRLSDAHLIAAAPEILEALQELLDYPKEDLEAWANGNEPITCTFLPIHFKKALLAIQKATGNI